VFSSRRRNLFVSLKTTTLCFILSGVPLDERKLTDNVWNWQPINCKKKKKCFVKIESGRKLLKKWKLIKNALPSSNLSAVFWYSDNSVYSLGALICCAIFQLCGESIFSQGGCTAPHCRCTWDENFRQCRQRRNITEKSTTWHQNIPLLLFASTNCTKTLPFA